MCIPKGSLAQLLRLATPTHLCQTDTEQGLHGLAPSRQTLLLRPFYICVTQQHLSLSHRPPHLKAGAGQSHTYPWAYQMGFYQSVGHKAGESLSWAGTLIPLRTCLPPGSCFSRRQSQALPLAGPQQPPGWLHLSCWLRAELIYWPAPGSIDIGPNPAPPLPRWVTLMTYISLGPRLLINKKTVQPVGQPAHSEEGVSGTGLDAASRMAPTHKFYHPTWARSFDTCRPYP